MKLGRMSVPQSLQPQGRVMAMENIFNAAKSLPALSVAAPAKDGEASAARNFLRRFHAVPWWAISAALHVLLIALASLITMAVERHKDDDTLLTVVDLAPAPKAKVVAMPKNETSRSPLESPRDTPSDEPHSQPAPVAFMPEALAGHMGLEAHFASIGPDLPGSGGGTGGGSGGAPAHFFKDGDATDFSSARSEAVIGAGAADGGGALGFSSKGGWQGARSTEIVIGLRGSRGVFGSRSEDNREQLLERHGGSKATESAVQKALEWLARHQEPDGSWETKNAAHTSFALLAFLGAGHTCKVGKYRDNVQRGLCWLVRQLKENERCSTCNYTQGLVAFALAEACAMMPDNTELRDAAQKAINGVSAGQHKTGSAYEAWDYTPSWNENDTSASGFNIQALKAAKAAGLKVDVFSVEGALRWINAGQDLKSAPKNGDAEYWEGGSMSYRGTCSAPNTGQGSQAMTSIAALTRLFLGGDRPDHPGVAGPCNLLKKNEMLPSAAALAQSYNLYTYYYGTLIMFQKGGEHWAAWNKAMKPLLIDAQRKDGDFAGSWNNDFYGSRVMQTALGAMCLEVYYRYQRIYE
jgi:hypothetical protein